MTKCALDVIPARTNCPCTEGYLCRYSGHCEPDECGCSEGCIIEVTAGSPDVHENGNK